MNIARAQIAALRTRAFARNLQARALARPALWGWFWSLIFATPFFLASNPPSVGTIADRILWSASSGGAAHGAGVLALIGAAVALFAGICSTGLWLAAQRELPAPQRRFWAAHGIALLGFALLCLLPGIRWSETLSLGFCGMCLLASFRQASARLPALWRSETELRARFPRIPRRAEFWAACSLGLLPCAYFTLTIPFDWGNIGRALLRAPGMEEHFLSALSMIMLLLSACAFCARGLWKFLGPSICDSIERALDKPLAKAKARAKEQLGRLRILFELNEEEAQALEKLTLSSQIKRGRKLAPGERDGKGRL